MEEILKQRVEELEKKVAALEEQVQEQPSYKNISLKIDGKTIAPVINHEFQRQGTLKL